MMEEMVGEYCSSQGLMREGSYFLKEALSAIAFLRTLQGVPKEKVTVPAQAPE